MCSEVAAQHGWTVETFVDAEGHRSGGSEKHRPEWRRLKKQLARPEVAAVIVGDITRASRSPKDFFLFLDECQQRGVQFISLKDNIDTQTASGRMTLGILIALAAWEREIASERVLTAIEYKRDSGKHWGLAPFGTKRDDNGILVESDDWPACRELLEAYATGNYSYITLATHLNSRGLRFRNRERALVPFDRDAVRSVVNNLLVYLGFVLRRKGRHVDVRIDYGEGDVIELLAEHNEAIRGQHAPLISRELAARIVQARRSSMRPHSRPRHTYLLSAILYCAHCHRPLRGNFLYGKFRYYHRADTCAYRPKRLIADAIEQKVLDLLKQLRFTASEREDLKRRIETRLHSAPQHSDALDAIRHLEAKLERLRTLFVEGDIDKAQYDAQKRSTWQALDEWRAQLGPRTVQLDVVLDQVNTLADILAHGTRDQQRRALMDVFEKIEIDLSGHITIIEPKQWVRAVFQEFCDGLLHPMSYAESQRITT